MPAWPRPRSTPTCPRPGCARATAPRIRARPRRSQPPPPRTVTHPGARRARVSSSPPRSWPRGCWAGCGWWSSATSSATTPTSTAYFAAFRIPDLIYQLVAAGAVGVGAHPGALGAARGGHAVARLAGRLDGRQPDARGLAGARAWWCSSGRPSSCPSCSRVRMPHATELTVQLTRIMLLSPIFLALGAVASAILNTQGRFGVAAWRPVVFNLAIIVCACVARAPRWASTRSPSAWSSGSFLHFAIQVPLLRRRVPLSRRASTCATRPPARRSG